MASRVLVGGARPHGRLGDRAGRTEDGRSPAQGASVIAIAARRMARDQCAAIMGAWVELCWMLAPGLMARHAVPRYDRRLDDRRWWLED